MMYIIGYSEMLTTLLKKYVYVQNVQYAFKYLFSMAVTLENTSTVYIYILVHVNETILVRF